MIKICVYGNIFVDLYSEKKEIFLNKTISIFFSQDKTQGNILCVDIRRRVY